MTQDDYTHVVCAKVKAKDAIECLKKLPKSPQITEALVALENAADYCELYLMNCAKEALDKKGSSHVARNQGE